MPLGALLPAILLPDLLAEGVESRGALKSALGTPRVSTSRGTCLNVKGLFASSGREAGAEPQLANCSSVPSGAKGPSKCSSTQGSILE